MCLLGILELKKKETEEGQYFSRPPERHDSTDPTYSKQDKYQDSTTGNIMVNLGNIINQGHEKLSSEMIKGETG